VAPLTVSRSTALALLFDRLKWPVPMVRWQTAKRIRNFLNDAATRDSTKMMLLDRLEACKFETEVCSLLTIIFLCEKPARPECGTVTTRIRKPSLLSDVLLDVIYGDGSGTSEWRHRNRTTMPDDFEADAYFDRFRTAHVPPIFSENLGRLERQSGLPFLQRWGFEWTVLCEELRVPHTSYPHYFDDSSGSRGSIVGQYWQRMREAYLSSYMRTLAYAVLEWGMPVKTARGYTLELANSIAGLFELEPSSRPAWMADLPERFCAEDADFDDLMRELFQASQREGRVLVSLDMPILRTTREHARLSISTHLCSSDYQLAAPATLFERLVVHDIADTFSLEGSAPVSSFAEATQAGAKGDQVGVCESMMPIPFGCWHNDYHSVGIAIPASYIAPGLSITASAGGLDLFDGKGVVRSRISTWNDHWSPSYPQKGNTRCAMMTTLDERLLANAAAKKKRNVGFFLNLSSWDREKEYGEYTRIERHRLIYM
jgi:hypothetical protein